MPFTGKVTYIGALEKVGSNETPKITIVVEEEGKEYPNSIAVDVWKDKTEWVSRMSVGSSVEMKLNSKAREHNGRYYNGISAWEIKEVKDSGLDNSGDDLF